MRFAVAIFLLGAVRAYAQDCNVNIKSVTSDNRYELLSNGSEVRDLKTGLIWQRCSIGQSWNGKTCAGVASKYKWTDALAKAKTVGNGYRLPNIKELQSLVEKSCHTPAINIFFFPETSAINAAGYWSSSLFTGYKYAWLVSFYEGETQEHEKIYGNYVRAVRDNQ